MGVKLPKALPGFSGGKLPGRRWCATGGEEGDEFSFDSDSDRLYHRRRSGWGGEYFQHANLSWDCSQVTKSLGREMRWIGP